MVKPTREQRRSKNNPWEILVIAALFFFPGVFMLVQRGPLIAVQQTFNWVLPSSVTAISEHGAHIFGGLAVGVGLVFLWFYFYLCRAIACDDPTKKPRWR
jgi:ABC-type multidrug transport system permease subunit